MRTQRMRVGGMCVFHYKDSKTVSPCCCCCCCSAQGLFQVHADFRAADNPTVTVTDCVELMYAWPGTGCPLSLSLQLSVSVLVSLSLCHDSYVPLYAQTQTDSWLDDFWLRRESASAHASSVVVWAQQVLATSLLLSSVLCVRVLECTVLQTQLKRKNHVYIGKFYIGTICFLSHRIMVTYLVCICSACGSLVPPTVYMISSITVHVTCKTFITSTQW